MMHRRGWIAGMIGGGLLVQRGRALAPLAHTGLALDAEEATGEGVVRRGRARPAW